MQRHALVRYRPMKELQTNGGVRPIEFDVILKLLPRATCLIMIPSWKVSNLQVVAIFVEALLEGITHHIA